jgi:hypothetical protein
LDLLHKLLIRANLNGRSVITVDNLLDFDGVSISFLNFGGVSKGDVFKAVNLTEAPEHGVTILASSLDLEHLSEVELLECGKCELIDHLVLGEGLRRVDTEVVGEIIAGVEVLEGLEEAEFANDVLR